MSTSTLFAAVLVGSGLALLAVGFLSRAYSREERLADILDLPYGETDVELGDVIDQHSTLVANLSQVAGRFVEQLDEKGSLATKLEKSRVPLRPGEFVVVMLAVGAVFGAFGWAITSQWFVGLIGIGAAFVVGNLYLTRRITKRRKKFEAQFPDALSLIASSLSAGHTFLRAIQMIGKRHQQNALTLRGRACGLGWQSLVRRREMPPNNECGDNQQCHRCCGNP